MSLSKIRFLLPATLLLLVPASVHAQLAAANEASPPREIAQFFNDLPGVHAQDLLNEPSKVVCEQIVQHRPGVEPTNGLRYHVLNSCSDEGGPAFQSPQLPLSLEREKRGLGY
ncbi:hypothetical protein QO002_000638 [Pararhizobium capsulatum DSM 1112]|uniref:Uncharacterized protein n=1 Tax=Pararhizobium capsulatum DSM 1112 TaxID=1121113 RepID=A0ABU0BM19_9HYPH|nr:hypothetical protein [Pararhizobium capsulatum]MDQ0318500.1 hypothetical protein [Pararhizobium capsulatum DSM 1112]